MSDEDRNHGPTSATQGVSTIDTGYIKLWRCLLGKVIWTQSTPAQVAIFITLLMMANFKANQWIWQGKKFDIKPGQFITSAASIIKNCPKGITRQNVRTALEKFRNLGFLTYESTKSGLLISIVNWRIYQGNNDLPNQETNQEVTINQPTGNQELTTIEECKKEKNERTLICTNVIGYLNQVCQTNYRQGEANKKHIIARINEGYTLNDFRSVIDKKAKEWLGTDHAIYLRPETLFGSKFDSYLNQPENLAKSGRQMERSEKEVIFLD